MTDPAAAEGPLIEGHTLIGWLGSGGYSDVFLYRRHDTDLRVAVKVLHAGRLDSAEREQFRSEGLVMARLAGHPNIVQVFSTGTTDDGRPYLVMRYYNSANLEDVVARQPLTQQDALRVGIKIAGALETAHTANILHRDIKPSNILVDDFDEPGLADFGIAGRTGGDEEEDADVGVSPPWAPPEVLSGKSNGSPAADVYSLAATVWHLLVGRSPFEIPGGDNSRKAMLGRILAVPARGTGRADVDERFNRILVHALSKNAAQRPQAAREFGLALQGLEQALRLQRTDMKIARSGEALARDAPAPAPAPPSGTRDRGPVLGSPGQATKRPLPEGSPQTSLRPQRPAAPDREPVRAKTNVRPQRPADQSFENRTARRPGTPSGPSPRLPAAGPATPERTSRRPQAPRPSAETSAFAPPSEASGQSEVRPSTIPPIDADLIDVEPWRTARPTARPAEPAPTVRPPRQVTQPPPTAASHGNRRTVRVVTAIGAAAVVTVAAVVVGVVVSTGGGKPASHLPATSPVGLDQGGIADSDVSPPVVQASYNGGAVTFTWTPGAGSGKVPTYIYTVGGSAAVGPTTATSALVQTTDPTSECIRVGVIASDGTEHLAAPVCGP